MSIRQVGARSRIDRQCSRIRRAGGKWRSFSNFETVYSGFTHQELARRHLSSQHQAAYTLVVTGKGRGKTACSVSGAGLMPIRQWCA
jgi:hypothetical protein